jgi:3D (Asp-Asp-Asp) domain-containing protein
LEVIYIKIINNIILGKVLKKVMVITFFISTTVCFTPIAGYSPDENSKPEIQIFSEIEKKPSNLQSSDGNYDQNFQIRENKSDKKTRNKIKKHTLKEKLAVAENNNKDNVIENTESNTESKEITRSDEAENNNNDNVIENTESNTESKEITRSDEKEDISEDEKYDFKIGGKKFKYKISGSVTAYTEVKGKKTSTGITAQVGIVAVNPKIIPYGSTLVIVFANGTKKILQAQDTGGALRNNKCVADIYMNSYEECINFGRKKADIYVAI